ncbi:MAG: DUF3413 domain-containing protein [Psychromonas sp.]|nr:DUF3413 domain-containing protein [Psychromonas sp.]
MVETGHPFHDRVSRLINWAHWFTFANVIIICLISIRYIVYAGVSTTALGISYQIISLIAHFSFLSAVVFILTLFPLAFIISSQRIYRAIAIIISTIAITFLILDTQIFKLYSFHLNPLIWRFLQTPDQAEKIYAITLHYISIAIIFCIEFIISWIIWQKKRNLQFIGIGKPIGMIIAIFFVLSHLSFIWADATQYRPITRQKSLFPLSYPMTARTFLKEQGWLTDNKLFSNITQQKRTEVKGAMLYPKKPLTYTNAFPFEKNLNILIITVGEFKADAINKYDMPNLYKDSELGLNYHNHFSGGNTRALGIFSLFYALPNNYWSDVRLNYISPVFINRLLELNYTFSLFSSAHFLYPEFSQSVYSRIGFQLNNVIGSRSNLEMTNQWLAWYAKQNKAEKPWFSFLYYKPKYSHILENTASLTVKIRAKKEQIYKQQLRKKDVQINKIINALKVRHALANTIVIITGAQGVSTFKKSSIKAAINDAHVPLVILWPNQRHRQIIRMTSHMDIVPTLMEAALGVKSDAKDYSIGQSLFDNSYRRYLLSGNNKHYIIYEKNGITQFSNDGNVRSINWQGKEINPDKFDITILIDAISKMRLLTKN